MKLVKRSFLYFFIVTALIGAMLALSACSLSKFFKGEKSDSPQLSISCEGSRSVYKGDKFVVKSKQKNIEGGLTWYMKYGEENWEHYSYGNTELEFDTSNWEIGSYQIKAEARESSVTSNIITIQVKAIEITPYLTVDGEKINNAGKTEIVGKDSAIFGFVLDTNNVYETNRIEYKISVYNSENKLIYDVNETNENFVDKEFKRVELKNLDKRTTIKFEVTYFGKKYNFTATVEKITDANFATVTKVDADNIKGATRIKGKHYYYKIDYSDNTIKIKPQVNGYFKEMKYTISSEDSLNGKLTTGTEVAAVQKDLRETVVELREGKNVIGVQADNSRGIEFEVYYFKQNKTFNKVREYLDNEWFWFGRYRSSYFKDIEDFNLAYGYQYSKQMSNVDKEFYMSDKLSDNYSLIQEESNIVKYAVTAGTLKYSMSTNDNILTLTVTSSSDLDFATPDHASKPNSSNPTLPTNRKPAENALYSNRTFRKDILGMDINKRDRLPVDDFDEEMDVETSEDLYLALEAWKKPNIKSARIQEIYDAARKILLDIIDDKMSDYEQVLAIYEYLSGKIPYDYKALNMNEEQVEDRDLKDLYCYFLEGVFKSETAVCDGKSKAFVLLCGMEKITATRVTGTIPGGPHAWNKVLLSINKAKAQWFNVDTTHGEYSVIEGGFLGKRQTAYLSHRSFLFSDVVAFKRGYKESKNMYSVSAVTDFDYYKFTTYTFNDSKGVRQTIHMYCENQAEFNDNIRALKSLNKQFDKKFYIDFKSDIINELNTFGTDFVSVSDEPYGFVAI